MRLKTKRTGGWMLYVWHGMCLTAWLGLLKRHRFRFTLNCLPGVLSVTLFSINNSWLALLDRLIYARRVKALKDIPSPVFVLGHWRSGTTYLHELMCLDTRLAYSDIYEVTFPDHFLLSRRFVGKWFNIFLPKRRPMDKMKVGVNRPQEDEFALCNMGVPSPYLTMAYPSDGPAQQRYLDLQDLSAAERSAWEAALLTFLKRQTLAKPGKRLVLKSPPHTARIDTLIRMFPDAKFVYIARDPLEVYASTMKFWKAMNSVQGLQNPADDDRWLEGYVLDTFTHLFNRYEACRELIPPGQLTEVTYESLVAEPKAQLAGLYAALNLESFEQALPAVDRYLEEASGHKVNPKQYTAEQVGKVRERWSAYIDRFGYREAIEAQWAKANATPNAPAAAPKP